MSPASCNGTMSYAFAMSMGDRPFTGTAASGRPRDSRSEDRIGLVLRPLRPTTASLIAGGTDSRLSGAWNTIPVEGSTYWPSLTPKTDASRPALELRRITVRWAYEPTTSKPWRFAHWLTASI